MKALVFDLGGTHLRCAVSDDAGALHELRKTRIESSGAESEEASTVVWDQLLGQMAEYAKSAGGEVPRQAPIIFCFPGPVINSQVLNAPTVSGKSQRIPRLKEELQRRTGREVHILNDVSAAAWHFSNQIAADRFMVLTVSSGIGSKIFDRRSRPQVIDRVPYAGEIGHAVVDSTLDAPGCDCGGKGHLGAISSGRGIERAARRSAQRDANQFMMSACVLNFGANASRLTNEDHIAPAARQGDPWALGIIRDCSRPLANVLIAAILAVGLEKVIVMGGFALSVGDVYLRILQGLLQDLCDYTVLQSTISNMVQLASADDEPGLLGAAAYIRMVAQ